MQRTRYEIFFIFTKKISSFSVPLCFSPRDSTSCTASQRQGNWGTGRWTTGLRSAAKGWPSCQERQLPDTAPCRVDWTGSRGSSAGSLAQSPAFSRTEGPHALCEERAGCQHAPCSAGNAPRSQGRAWLLWAFDLLALLIKQERNR